MLASLSFFDLYCFLLIFFCLWISTGVNMWFDKCGLKLLYVPTALLMSCFFKSMFLIFLEIPNSCLSIPLILSAMASS